MLSHSSYLSPDHNHFTIYGTQGTLSVEADRLVVYQGGTIHQVIDLPPDDPHANMWQALADAFQNGQTPAYPAARALLDVHILEKVDQAIHQNQVMRIEL
jgi:predicted dehydrogenase